MSEDEQLLERIWAATDADQVGYARHLCERYLEKHPDHVPTLIAYADHLTSLAQYSSVQEVLDRAQELTHKKLLPLILAHRGHLLAKQGDFKHAEELYLQAYELRHEDATYLIYAGSAAFHRGDIRRAKELVRLATSCSKGCVDEAWFNLGGYLLSEQRYFEAADCYRKALEIDPDYQIAAKRLRDVELILHDS